MTEKVLNGQGDRCTLATADLEASLGEIEAREFLPEHANPADNLLITEQSQTLHQQG